MAEEEGGPEIPVLGQGTLIQQLKTILNDVWDKANHRLMGSAWAGSGINSYMFETDTTILNDVWDPVNHKLNVASSGGSGTVTASGPPVAGQAAQWTSATDITGVAVTGTGSYVLQTTPTLTTPNVTTNLKINSASAGAQATVSWRDLTTNQWQLIKQTDNTFLLYDAVTPAQLWTVTRGVTALGITPNAATTMQGFSVIQSGPTTGSHGSAYFNYNLIDITSDQVSVTPGGTYANGLLVSFRTGGSNTQGSRSAIMGSVVLTAPSLASNPGRDHVGVYGVTKAVSGDGGTDTSSNARGNLFGLSSGAVAQSGATNLFSVSGGEVDVGIDTGASARFRFGWSLVGIGNLVAAQFDVGLEIASATQPWTNGIAFTSIHGAAPVTTSGTLIGTDGVAVTTTHGIDLSAYTFTTDAIKTPGFIVNGAGNTTTKTVAVRDTTAAFDVIIGATSSATLTADRILTLGMGNVAHTINLGTTAGTITFPNTAAMTVARIDAAQTFTGTNTFGIIQIAANQYIFPATINTTLLLLPNITTSAIAGVTLGTSSAIAAGTSGAQRGIESAIGFAPTSGSATFTQLNLAPTINQTGGASGVTSALAIAPTLTAAAAFTPIDVQLALVAGGARVMKLATSGPQLLVGSGAPSLSASQGSIYLRSDGSTGITRAYINTDGSTTWTAITTVA